MSKTSKNGYVMNNSNHSYKLKNYISSKDKPIKITTRKPHTFYVETSEGELKKYGEDYFVGYGYTIHEQKNECVLGIKVELEYPKVKQGNFFNSLQHGDLHSVYGLDEFNKLFQVIKN